jgi:hypothetical protein
MLRINNKQLIGIGFILFGFLLASGVISYPFALLTIYNPFNYPTIDGKLIGSTNANRPDNIPLSKYSNVEVMISSEEKFSSVQLRYSSSAGGGTIDLQLASSSWWEYDYKGYIPRLYDNVLYEFQWIGDGAVYLTTYIVFGGETPRASVLVEGKSISDGHVFKDRQRLNIEIIVESGYTRSGVVVIYPSIEGKWISNPQHKILSKTDRGYRGTIDFEGGTYKVIVELDYSSRYEPLKLVTFYVENPQSFSFTPFIGIGLVAFGGYLFYKGREED